MEVYFEKNVINDGVEKRSKKVTAFKVIKYIFIALFVVVLYYNLFIKDLSLGNKGTPYIVFLIFTSLAELSLPILGFIIFHRLFNKATAEISVEVYVVIIICTV